MEGEDDSINDSRYGQQAQASGSPLSIGSQFYGNVFYFLHHFAVKSDFATLITNFIFKIRLPLVMMGRQMKTEHRKLGLSRLTFWR